MLVTYIATTFTNIVVLQAHNRVLRSAGTNEVAEK